MDLKERYKKETNLEVYILDAFTGDFENTDYVKQLESKINFTGSSLELKDRYKKDIEELETTLADLINDEDFIK